MIFLIVKGSPADVADAAMLRGIPIEGIRPGRPPHKGESWGRTPDVNLPAVASWLGEPGRAEPGLGFPAGTLLFYSVEGPTSC